MAPVIHRPRPPSATPVPRGLWRLVSALAPLLLPAAAAVPVAALAHALFGLGLPVAGWRDAAVFFVLAPLLEEWVVRAQLQAWLEQRLRGLRHAGHWAQVLATLFFAALHAPSAGWLCVLWCLPGLALGELWRRRSSLAMNAGLHAWFNLALWWVSAAR